MRKFAKSSALLVLATVLCCPPAAFSESCHSVGGKVKMVNLANEITQTGTVKMALTNSNGDEVFNSKGQLVGTITGRGDWGDTFLSHTAILKDGSSFITNGDIASIISVRAFTPEGIPCSFYVQEKLTDITEGTGFFENVESVDILADGYISICLPDENENKFVLSGTVCVN